ncbi:hypothetical protein V1514DRAFT_326047 [Lipomyces japonicus]|uniref:uncharacterized protein n=1 Tax=Lipomyces japonicus TaxID=56871 RepID=UPI0034D01E2D
MTRNANVWPENLDKLSHDMHGNTKTQSIIQTNDKAVKHRYLLLSSGPPKYNIQLNHYNLTSIPQKPRKDLKIKFNEINDTMKKKNRVIEFVIIFCQRLFSSFFSIISGKNFIIQLIQTMCLWTIAYNIIVNDFWFNSGRKFWTEHREFALKHAQSAWHFTKVNQEADGRNECKAESWHNLFFFSRYIEILLFNSNSDNQGDF